MQQFEFLSYIPTPTEKYAGVVTIRILGKSCQNPNCQNHNNNMNIIQRFKWQERKDGKGFFSCSPSLKITEDGQESYEPSFYMDSRTEQEALEKIIRYGVNQYIKKNITQIKMEGSINDYSYDNPDPTISSNTSPRDLDNMPF